uniref:Zgc:162339 n=1 Tax=Neogobius melanostomus TaxID=47308 RepID=A0A8C6WFI7_9GOBI
MMKMSKQPIGKTLLRNVIRHTDAHNKIQEEMEMWKMREWETQTSQRKHLSAAASMRGHMHCDQELDPSRHISRSRVSEHDDRDARYWTKQLYEFEAKDPDRWGHSGFKELYPEEFSSDSRDSSDSQKMTRTKGKKSRSAKEARLSKRSKKSSRKKKKKRRKRTRRASEKKLRAEAVTVKVMIVVLLKTDPDRGKGPKVDIKTRKVLKNGGILTAAQWTVTVRKKKRDRPPGEKNASRTLINPSTLSLTPRKRGKIGGQLERRAQMEVLETEMLLK